MAEKKDMKKIWTRFYNKNIFPFLSFPSFICYKIMCRKIARKTNNIEMENSDLEKSDNYSLRLFTILSLSTVMLSEIFIF